VKVKLECDLDMDNNAILNYTGGCLIATGTYTGDGAVSKKITTGFTVKWVKIWTRQVTHNDPIVSLESTDTIVDDNESGAAIRQANDTGDMDLYVGCIVSLDSDGFTVGDAGSDFHPNQNGTAYNYLALGVAG